MAIVLGTSIGSLLFTILEERAVENGPACSRSPSPASLVSLGIPEVPAAALAAPFRWNPFAEVVTGTKHLLTDRPLWLTVLGISYFWFLGALFQMDLLLFGKEMLRSAICGSG